MIVSSLLQEGQYVLLKMKLKQLFIGLSFTIISVVFIIAIFSSGGMNNILAEENLSDFKVYDSLTKTVIIKDNETRDIVSIKLLTPLNNKVGLGYQKVAEYEIDSIENLKIFLSEMELYDRNDNNRELNRQIEYKVKEIEQVKVLDYDIDCSNVKLNPDGTYDPCEKTLIGNHMEDRIVWNTLDQLDFIKGEKIIVGIFTDVQKGDKIEWIPTFMINDDFEIKVEEWAVWTADLNTDLDLYYRMENKSDEIGNLDMLTWEGSDNFTSISCLIGDCASMKVNGGHFIIPSTAYTNLQDGDHTWTFWISMSTIANGHFSANASSPSYLTGTDGNGDLYVSGFGPGPVGGSYRFVQNQWTMMSYVHNGSTFSIYQNDTLVSTATSTLGDFEHDMSIGIRNNGNQDVVGLWDEMGFWSRALTPTEITQVYNGGTGLTYVPTAILECAFTGYVLDEGGTGLVGANVTIFNQFNLSERYTNVTIANGLWTYNVTNSTNTYMVSAVFNNTLVAKLKQGISGTC